MFHCVRFLALLSLLLAAILPAIAQTRSGGPMETISIDVSEGTDLGLDLSPDENTIAIDLLGQLWLLPAGGGNARAVTDAVRDVAEDNDPSFSPDGKRIVFRGERNGRTGLFLLDVATGAVRQLTQLSVPESYDGDAAWSPDGRSIAFARAVPPDMKAGTRWHFVVMVLDVTSGAAHELSISGIDKPQLRSPVWTNGGRDIAFIAVKTRADQSGRVWTVPAAGGAARAVTDGSIAVRSPVFSADGRRIAYFADDSDDRTQLWVNEIGGGAPIRLTSGTDVTPTRVRWIRNDSALLYTANGRLWTVAANGGTPSEIKFAAALSITRPKHKLPPARFPEPGRQEPARGFMGLAVAPDGKQIGMLALGKLWIFPVGGTPKAISNVPFEAAALTWSPDGGEVAWTAGVAGKEHILATDVKTGSLRRVTVLPGREAFPVYSPDGRYLAFVHFPNDDDATLRIVDAKANNITDVAQTRDLGSIGTSWTCAPQWSPESDGLLVCGGTNPDQLGKATFVPLAGQRQTITRFPDAPIFLSWTPQHRIVYCRHDRLWQAGFDRTGMTSEPQPLGASAAMYSSTSKDGSVLFFSDVGLRLRSLNGAERKIGFPLTFTPPAAEATLIRNVRIIDGTGAQITSARDILIENGRISKIAPTDSIPAGGARVINAGGRIVMPGLMDLHAHTYRPDLLPGYPYFGVTTIRDQGSSMGPLVSYANDIAAGLLPGPRVSYGGFQFYSDWGFDEEQGRGIEPEADPNHIRRSVSLLAAFGAQHIKTRTFRRWDINARMIKEAHRLGLRATGHCSHLLPLIAAGMDAKEHIGSCEERGDTHVYDDIIQLFKAAGISVVPTISYFELAVRLSGNNDALDSDVELASFMPERNNFGWMFGLKDDYRKTWLNWYKNAGIDTTRLWKAGINLGTGTDIWQLPIGVHWELERFVDAGMTPLEAIHAATGASAKILGADKDLGTIEAGKWADLVILDADPLMDIRNTRRIWQVFRSGAIVDRAAVLKLMKPK